MTHFPQGFERYAHIIDRFEPVVCNHHGFITELFPENPCKWDQYTVACDGNDWICCGDSIVWTGSEWVKHVLSFSKDGVKGFIYLKQGEGPNKKVVPDTIVNLFYLPFVVSIVPVPNTVFLHPLGLERFVQYQGSRTLRTLFVVEDNSFYNHPTLVKGCSAFLTKDTGYPVIAYSYLSQWIRNVHRDGWPGLKYVREVL